VLAGLQEHLKNCVDQVPCTSYRNVIETAHINVKKQWFRQKLIANYISKTAKITKGDIAQQHIDI